MSNRWPLPVLTVTNAPVVVQRSIEELDETVGDLPTTVETLVDDQTFQIDEYQGFHADIFVHTDGHSYIGNNVAVSVLAAVPLFVFDPVLDALERYRLNQPGERPLLVVLWASWCPHCREELESLTAAEASLRETGLDVLALSIDHLQADGDAASGDAAKLLADMNFPFDHGRATERNSSSSVSPAR